jgi:hypothetical protein
MPPLRLSFFVAVVVSLTTFGSLSAQTNLLTNGDFETGGGGTFDETPGWYNRGQGDKQDSRARTNTMAHGGSYSATVSDRYDVAKSAFSWVAHCQKTTYTIKAGDSFSVSYFWRPVDSGWQLGRDNVQFVLFSTDNNTVGGNLLWSSTLTSGNFAGADLTVWKSVSDQTSVVAPASVGKALFVCFYGVDRGKILSTDVGYARVDDIVVTAIAPASRTQ